MTRYQPTKNAIADDGGALHGACLCGQVRFALAGGARALYQCHCSLCRKQGGIAVEHRDAGRRGRLSLACRAGADPFVGQGQRLPLGFLFQLRFAFAQSAAWIALLLVSKSVKN